MGVDAPTAEWIDGTDLGTIDPSELRVPKTVSWQLLGHTHEIIFEANSMIADDGGTQEADIDAVNRQLRRRLSGHDYIRPVELATAHSRYSRDPQLSDPGCGP